MDSKIIRRINAAKEIFNQDPIEYEHPNIFGIEDRKVAPVPLPYQQPQYQQPQYQQPQYQEPVPVPQDAYQAAEYAALSNPNDIAAQQAYQALTAQKLSGGGRSQVKTEVFLRQQERSRVVKRSHELSLRRKIATASEKPKF
jgi:hypothetical protein